MSLFWKNLAERALKTFAQALLAALGTGALDVIHVNWIGALSVAVGATVLSVLTSVATGVPTVVTTPAVSTPAAAAAVSATVAVPAVVDTSDANKA
jgi:hypothetical protein